MQKYLLIAIGGALGSIARVWVSSAVTNRMGFKFPYGTLIVNLTACLIIGFAITFLGRRADLNPAWRFLIPMGFIGVYLLSLLHLRVGDAFHAAQRCILAAGRPLCRWAVSSSASSLLLWAAPCWERLSSIQLRKSLSTNDLSS